MWIWPCGSGLGSTARRERAPSRPTRSARRFRNLSTARPWSPSRGRPVAREQWTVRTSKYIFTNFLLSCLLDLFLLFLYFFVFLFFSFFLALLLFLCSLSLLVSSLISSHRLSSTLNKPLASFFPFLSSLISCLLLLLSSWLLLCLLSFYRLTFFLCVAYSCFVPCAWVTTATQTVSLAWQVFGNLFCLSICFFRLACFLRPLPVSLDVFVACVFSCF